ncbi:MAG: hypothetical protein Q7S74_05350 [Nanoarchaeota archaeon]|nr:hypothetical protein [Nanoarchaeota archaeon]
MSLDDNLPDPIESASKGFVKALVELSLENISDLVKKFKDRKLAFIQDEETIKIVKE